MRPHIFGESIFTLFITKRYFLLTSTVASAIRFMLMSAVLALLFYWVIMFFVLITWATTGHAGIFVVIFSCPILP